MNSNSWDPDRARHTMSTVLPKMTLWCEHQARLALGREGLVMQGFPVTPFLELVQEHMQSLPLAEQWFPSENLMMDLAGNAMALPVVLAMLQCALVALNWKDGAQSLQVNPLSHSEDRTLGGRTQVSFHVLFLGFVLLICLNASRSTCSSYLSYVFSNIAT